MANKLTLQNLVTTNLGDTPLIIPEKHRDVENALIENSYATIITESLTGLINTTVNTTPDNTDKYYTINYGKQGRFVNISGNLTNKTGSITSNSTWFTFDTTDYLPDNTNIIFFASTTTGTVVRCQIIGSVFKILDAIGNNQTIYFDTKYYTLN